MANYYRVMLGESGKWARECIEGGFICASFGIRQDLSAHLHERWQRFNREFVPLYQKSRPDKTKIAAGLAMGALWTVCKGILQGDIVLSPDGEGACRVAEVVGDYRFVEDSELVHRRPVRWLDRRILKSEMSPGLRGAVFTQGTVRSLSKYQAEIEDLLAGLVRPAFPAVAAGVVGPEGDDSATEDPLAFAMEKHLEDFLVENWSQTELGKDYEVYFNDGELVGRQYMTDTGPIDILAISKDKKRLLVVELKRGRASDAVVGQVLRYIGYVKTEVAESGQEVRGAIIAFEDDHRLRRAISAVSGVEFYRYKVSFTLVKDSLTEAS